MTQMVVGRRKELRRIAEAVDTCRTGSLVVVSLEGEAGMGKSTLIEQVRGKLLDPLFDVIAASGAEWAIARPFSSLRRSGAIVPALDVVDVIPVQAVDEVVDDIEARALRAPVAFLADDVHWLDPATVAVLEVALRRLQGLPVLMLLSFRPLPPGSDAAKLVGLAQRSDCRNLVLRPLDAADVGALAELRLGARPGPGLLAMLAGAGGHPLFVREVLDMMLAGSGLIFGGGTVEANDLDLPASVRLAVARHLGFLTAGLMELLQVAAVMGPEVTVPELAAVSGRHEMDVLERVEALVRAGLVAGADARLTFRHDLIREVVLADLDEAVRSAWDRRAWKALAALGAPPMRLAQHVIRVAERGDAVAARVLLDAAATAGATSVAIQLLRSAAEFAPDELVEECEGREVVALAYSEETASAEEAARRYLARHVRGVLRSDVWLALVHALFVQGRWDKVIDAADAAVADPATADVATARLLAERALARIWTEDIAGARADAEAAAALAQRSGDSVGEARAHAHRSVVACRDAAFDDAVALARQGATVAERVEATLRVQPLMSLGMAHVARGDFRDAVDVLHRARGIAESGGASWDVAVHHAMVALPLFYGGEWDDAAAEAQTALSTCGDEIPGVASVTACSVVATISAHRGDLDGARQMVRRARAIVESSGPQWGEAWLAAADALTRLHSGDANGAFETVAVAVERARRAMDHEALLHVTPAALRAATAVGRGSFVEALTDDLAVLAGRSTAPFVAAGLDLARGLAAADVDLLLHAAERYLTAGRLPDAAATFADAARVAGSSSSRSDSRVLGGRAVAAWEPMGVGASAPPLSGVRGSRSRGRAARPTSGWDALTKTELKVVRLVAGGLTNPAIAGELYISRSTVQTHLSHVFTKLGISTRAALAAEAIRRGLDPV